MVDERQRYCPHCDRAFLPEEAVLACSACGRLHHPACWVKFRACSAGCEDAHPEALAYEMPEPRRQDPHPAEGTRVAGQAPVIGAQAGRDPVERVGPDDGGEVHDDQGSSAQGQPPGMLGRARPNAGRSDADPVVVQPPPRAQHGRYSGPEGRPPVEDLRLYRRRGILRYWYVPLAAILAVLVAVGVVWGADQFLGGEGEDDVPAAADDGDEDDGDGIGETGDDEATPTPDENLPTVTPTPGDDATNGDTAGGGGDLSAGMQVTVAGTDGEGLNVRSEPGIGNDVVQELADGSEVTVIDGPTEEGEFTWWQIQYDAEGQGWVAGDYLVPAEEAAE